MLFVALALQIGGLGIAAVALILEWRSESQLSPEQLSSSARRRENPWEERLTLPRYDPGASAYSRFSGVRFNELAAQREALKAQGQAAFTAKFFGQWLKEREALLAADWQRQADLDQALSDGLVRVFNDQARLLTEQQNRTRARVKIEMLGLIIAMAGTVLASVLPQ